MSSLHIPQFYQKTMGFTMLKNWFLGKFVLRGHDGLESSLISKRAEVIFGYPFHYK